jgi:hypothetical protein
MKDFSLVFAKVTWEKDGSKAANQLQNHVKFQADIIN